MKEHGPGPCASLGKKEYLAALRVFIAAEVKLIAVLQKEAAARDMRYNPEGGNLVIEDVRVPGQPSMARQKLTLTQAEGLLTRSYCWEAVPIAATPLYSDKRGPSAAEGRQGQTH